MPQDLWPRLIRDTELWWEGRLGRPLVPVVLCKDGPTPQTRLPFNFWMPAYAADANPEEIIDAYDARLSKHEYLSDYAPMFWFNYGPGVIAAWLGSEADFDGSTVWFHPREQREIQDIKLQPGWDHPWLKQLEAVMRAADRRWQGSVQVGMTDLGGNLDIVSSFRPGENLLFDLYDAPHQVERLTWQAHEAWWTYFQHLTSLVPHNPGYSSWANIFSCKPHYMLQCDFCYMISPDMFDRFVKPELAATCRRLGGRAFYHLDGPGQLPHLDSLLSIPELAGIQWVPGTGNRRTEDWPEVFAKIQKAGKKAQFIGSDLAGFVKLTDRIGSADNIVVAPTWIKPEQLDQTLRLLDSLGVPVM